jgi:hypothetical protein
MNDKFRFPDEDATNNEVKTDEKVEISADGDVEIEIVDDTPPKDRGRKPLDREVEEPTESELDEYSEKVQGRIKELTHARHDERRKKEALQRERDELERLAQHMVAENKRLKEYVQNGSQQYGEMAKTAAEAELEQARRALKAAQEAFDTDAIVEAQEALFSAKIKAEQAKNFKPPSLQEEETPVQPRPSEPQRVQPDEKTLRWQAKNQWFGADGFEEVTSFALGLHQKLVTNGVDPRSDEYFEQIDARVKSKFPEVFGETEDRRGTPSTSPKKPAAVAAPATRSSGAKTIQLTPTQIALAKKFGLTPKQYAEQVAKLEKQNG